eukprot:CAMPEP_0197833358 /NCGR_PEP_ID=MMETSP1437-20131217/18782_1 /TAXON_ID=49252 ORGANISM="Eucampia antarctica, Strain CCMP1452" /NCGR_SAMPLE_ID=MMETSP1437 /ASSEMBLY_ACC=CAM_ASM_001096 /LENGTH=207 /DNA_ID=CAMNT_0043437357 /DNA_START=50 /DNA_END=673 /DNA_ORIENTATION=+
MSKAVKESKEVVKYVQKSEKAEPKFSFYINIHVLDKKQLIKAAVDSSKMVPKFMSDFTASLGASVVSDESIIGQITDELLKEFPAEMEKAGVLTEFEQVFTKGTMAVLRCSIMSIDFAKAIRAEKGEEGIMHYQNMIDGMKYFDMSDDEIASTMGEVELDMLKEFPEEIGNELKAEFEKEGLKVNVECKTEEEQAKFLFDYMKEHMS